MKSLYSNVNPNILFICTIACLPCVLFINNIISLWAITLFFIILRIMKNGRVKIVPSIVITVSIIFFALLTPIGKIYVSIGAFRITEGALFLGLQKAGVLLSMLSISQYAISRNLHLKGKIGYFVNAMFYFFDSLTDHKAKFSIKKPFSSIDMILIEVYNTNQNQTATTPSALPKQNATTWALCLFPVCVCYAVLIISIM